MAKTIVIGGYGPGISEAVARKFGGEGFAVALVARGREKVERGAAALREAGIEARAFAVDLSDPAAARALVADAREALGPIAVLHWNAYSGAAGDLTQCDVSELHTVVDVGATSLVAAMQAALPDLEAAPDAAILVTGGGFGLYEPKVDQIAVKFGAMGLAIAKAVQHKLVGLLHAKLSPRGIYVGEVMVLGSVKGTAFDSGQATLEASAIAERFWQIYRERTDVTVRVG